ncbi:MAG: diguanylate cyclase [Clostridiales bacterium]|nr:diguanylate cyclase [Clostridiales bacterium]
MDSEDRIKEGYSLVWCDEFSGSDIDRSFWNVEEHPENRINGELQSFADDGRHVFVEDDHLVIAPERVIQPGRNISYRSGRISTEHKFDFTYGYIEIRAKMSKGKGFFSVIRLIPTGETYGKWPVSGSVDLATTDGQYPERVTSIIHCGDPHKQRSGSADVAVSAGPDDYHIYACEWMPGRFAFFLDGKEYYSESDWFCRDGNGNEMPYPAPFDKPFNLELDVAVGGSSTGAPDRSTVFDEDSKMLVDYVRVYRRDDYDPEVKRPERNKEFKPADSTGNLITYGEGDWHFDLYVAGEALFEKEGGLFTVRPSNDGEREYSIQISQPGLPLRKGNRYRLSFKAMAQKKRIIRTSVTSPNLNWIRYLDDTVITLEPSWQSHTVEFLMEQDDDPDARLEFNLGSCGSTAAVSITGVRLEQVVSDHARRKIIAVCGSWEDAENYNNFMESLLKENISDDYVLAGFTFGKAAEGQTDVSTGLEFAGFIDRFKPSAIFVFTEMIGSDEIVRTLRQVAWERNIPAVFLEHQYDGVINAVLDYSTGFEKIVEHILDHHGCKKVKFFGGSKDNPFSIERENIYRRLMLSRKLEIGKNDILYGGFWDATAALVLENKLNEGMEIPDAFICANDSMAAGVCDCLIKRGYKIPEDVLVTEFDGIWHGRLHDPVITTAAPDYGKLMHYVFDVLEGRSAFENGKTVKVPVGYKVALENSCGCGSRDYEELANAVNILSCDNQDYFRHILEMGKFVTRSLSMNNIDEAAVYLNRYLWLWKDQYYFVGLTSEDGGCVHSLLHGNNGDYANKEKYYNMASPLPDLDLLLRRGSGINVLLVRQLRSLNTVYGYMCSGFEDLTLRKQQRFEEFGLYISATISSVIDKTRILEANRAISRLNESDYLTDLYNRRGFFARMDKILKEPRNKGRVFSLFAIDMDGLKYINDTFGHHEGDNALITLAKSLRAYAGDRGICARYGGDEFAMAIVGDVCLADDYQDIRTAIHDHAMKDPCMHGVGYNVNASMGIAECIISDSVDIEDLIKLADRRMYEDKEARKKEIDYIR